MNLHHHLIANARIGLRTLILLAILVSSSDASKAGVLTYSMSGRLDYHAGIGDVGLNGGRFQLRLAVDTHTPPLATFTTSTYTDTRFSLLSQEIELFGTAGLDGKYTTFFSLVNVRNRIDTDVAPDSIAFVHNAVAGVAPTIDGKYVTFAGWEFDFESSSVLTGPTPSFPPMLNHPFVSVAPSISGAVPQVSIFDTSSPATGFRLYIARDVRISSSVVPEPSTSGIFGLLIVTPHLFIRRSRSEETGQTDRRLL